MLNLSRTVGEIVRIGDDIEVHVERITGNCVRLGFTAPREVAIYRDEVYRQRASAKEAAARATASPAGAEGMRHRRRSPCKHPAGAQARYVCTRGPVTPARPRPRVAGRPHRDR